VTRETSLAAYQGMVDSGQLGKSQLRVWQALREYGPMTGAEIDKLLLGRGGRGHFHKRLPELVRLGVAVEKRRRPCAVTGNEAIEWEATDTPPLTQKGSVLKRPSVSSIVRALGEIKMAFNQVSWEPSEDTRQLLLWIDRKVVKTPLVPVKVTLKPIGPKPKRQKEQE